MSEQLTPEQTAFENIVEPMFERIVDCGYSCFMMSFQNGSVALNGAVGAVPPDRSHFWFGLGALMAKYADPGDQLEDAERCFRAGYDAQKEFMDAR